MASSGHRLPNLIICGVHKAGTTSLFSYLGKHPEICPSYTKEIHFFMPLVSGEALPPMAEYAKHFAHCSRSRYRLEASPSYLYGREAIAGAIRQYLGDAKVIAILRDPTERFVSYYNRAVSNSLIDDTFDDYVALSLQHHNSGEQSPHARNIRDGMYIDFIPPWLENFGDDFRIVFFDQLQSDTLALIGDLCRWLELDAGVYSADDFPVENRTLHYRHKSLHRRVRDWYMRHETFWRRHNDLKQSVRRIYNVVNRASNVDTAALDRQGIDRLRAFYEPCNARLSSFLRDRKYPQLPAWLERAASGMPGA
jgi:hypothetical protein